MLVEEARSPPSLSTIAWMRLLPIATKRRLCRRRHDRIPLRLRHRARVAAVAEDRQAGLLHPFAVAAHATSRMLERPCRVAPQEAIDVVGREPRPREDADEGRQQPVESGLTTVAAAVAAAGEVEAEQHPLGPARLAGGGDQPRHLLGVWYLARETESYTK